MAATLIDSSPETELDSESSPEAETQTQTQQAEVNSESSLTQTQQAELNSKSSLTQTQQAELNSESFLTQTLQAELNSESSLTQTQHAELDPTPTHTQQAELDPYGRDVRQIAVRQIEAEYASLLKRQRLEKEAEAEVEAREERKRRRLKQDTEFSEVRRTWWQAAMDTPGLGFQGAVRLRQVYWLVRAGGVGLKQADMIKHIWARSGWSLRKSEAGPVWDRLHEGIEWQQFDDKSWAAWVNQQMAGEEQK